MISFVKLIFKGVWSNFFFFKMNFTRSIKKTVLLILTVMIMTLLFSSIISIWLSKVIHLEVPSLGTIKTIGVEAYVDEKLENKIEKFDWDVIWLGSSKNITLYVKSISNMKTVLQLNATNWNPKNITEYLYLSWNYNGTPIDPGKVIKITITLSSPSLMSFDRAREYLIVNKVKEFNFDIIIYAREVVV